jgi:hypothetical protein
MSQGLPLRRISKRCFNDLRLRQHCRITSVGPASELGFASVVAVCGAPLENCPAGMPDVEAPRGEPSRANFTLTCASVSVSVNALRAGRV